MGHPHAIRMVLWGLASAAAVLAFSLAPAAGIAVCAVGGAAVLVFSTDALPVRLATAAAILAAAADWSVAAWLIPLAGAIVAMLPAPPRESQAGLDELQRHLDRSRRRDESVHLLYVGARSASGAFDEREVVRVMRLSDSIWLRGSGAAQHLIAVLDDHRLERAGVERRLAAAARGPIRVGWAQFPADGASLERLLECARAAADDPSVAHAAPEPGDVISMTDATALTTNFGTATTLKGMP